MHKFSMAKLMSSSIVGPAVRIPFGTVVTVARYGWSESKIVPKVSIDSVKSLKNSAVGLT